MSRSNSSPARPLNVGIVVVPWSENGIITHAREVIPRLRERGHKVTLTTTARYAGIAEANAVRIYRCLPFPTKLYGFMPSAILSIFGALRDCDVINVYGYPLFLTDYLTITRFLHKKPLVITLAGSFSPFTSQGIYKLKKLHNICMLRFQGLVNKFIAVSLAEKNEVVSQGIAEEKVEVIPSAAAKDYLSLKRNNLQTTEKKVLYLGRLASSKNVELLIEAMKYVVSQDSHTRLVLAGPDFEGERNNLETLVSRLDLKSNVEFMGRVSEERKKELLASCHIFVHPSLTDIFALTILEAAMAELPSVAFNVGGNSEMIVNGKTGILVEQFTPEALASALLRVLNNEDLAQKLGEEARRYVSDKFSWEKVAAGLEKVYYEALGLETNAIGNG